MNVSARENLSFQESVTRWSFPPHQNFTVKSRKQRVFEYGFVQKFQILTRWRILIGKQLKIERKKETIRRQLSGCRCPMRTKKKKVRAWEVSDTVTVRSIVVYSTHTSPLPNSFLWASNRCQSAPPRRFAWNGAWSTVGPLDAHAPNRPRRPQAFQNSSSATNQ